MTLHEQIIQKAKARVRPMRIAYQLGCSKDQVYNAISKARKDGETIPYFNARRVVDKPEGNQDAERTVILPDNLWKLVVCRAEATGASINQAACSLIEKGAFGGGANG